MAYNHKQVVDTVRNGLLENPRTSLRALSEQLGLERHTIRRALVGHLGMTFRALQRKYLIERASALRDDPQQRSVKEMSFELGYRSATSMSRLLRRQRVRDRE